MPLPTPQQSELIPQRYVTRNDFMYLRNFDDTITDDLIDEAFRVVYTRFYGVTTLWAKLPKEVREAKRRLVYHSLVAWYLAVYFPTHTKGITTQGSMPLTGKAISNVKLQFSKETSIDNSLSDLELNPFGITAKTEIQNAPEAFTCFGSGRRGYPTGWL